MSTHAAPAVFAPNDYVDIMAAPYGAKGDGVTDDTAAYEAALLTGKPIMVPETGSFYKLTRQLTLPATARLLGLGQPSLKFIGAIAGACILAAGAGAIMRHLTIDFDKASKSVLCDGVDVTGSRILIEHCRLSNAHDIGIKITGDYNKVLHGLVTGSGQPNIQILGPGVTAAPGTAGGSYNKVQNVELTGGLGFGLHLENAAHDNSLDFNWCIQSGLELIGVTYGCYRNQIIGNHAEGSGDNGISVTGYENVVNGNLCVKNANAGIHIYGSNNTCAGNTCLNNNQSRLSTPTNIFAGIDLGASWGGFGSGNTVIGNICIDDQATPTQEYGINQGAGFYPAWALSLNLTYPYVSSGLAIYKRVAGATAVPAAGAVVPSHTSGDVNDGTITWRYVGTCDTNLNGKRNQIIGNRYSGNRTKGYIDTTGNAHTVLHEGTMTLDAGPISGSTSPTLPIQIIAANGSPATLNIAGNPGDLLLRKGGSVGITAYLKKGGFNDSTNWVAIVTREQGITTARPTLGTGYEGFIYFDTTLGKPIWFKNPGWVDATGAAV